MSLNDPESCSETAFLSVSALKRLFPESALNQVGHELLLYRQRVKDLDRVNLD